MKPTLPISRAVLSMVCLVFLALACAPYPYYGPGPVDQHPERGGHIGILETSGPNVFVDGRKGRYGESISEGMTVRTGESSSARIRYADGGFCQLDENTDPWFGIRVDQMTGRECVYIRIEVGQVFIDKNLHCFETPDVAGVLNSRANLKVLRGESELAVFEGKAETYRPPGVVVGGRQLAVFSQGRLTRGPRRMNPVEMTQVPSWLNRYVFTERGPVRPQRRGWCCSEGRIFESTPQDCEGRRGFFSYNEREVRDRCLKRGWCCRGGRVFESSPEACNRRGDFFSYDEREARKMCTPHVQ